MAAAIEALNACALHAFTAHTATACFVCAYLCVCVCVCAFSYVLLICFVHRLCFAIFAPNITQSAQAPANSYSAYTRTQHVRAFIISVAQSKASLAFIMHRKQYGATTTRIRKRTHTSKRQAADPKHLYEMIQKRNISARQIAVATAEMDIRWLSSHACK